MVHVSMVSGTPLGLRDMTVISQITDRWRAGARWTALFTQLSLSELSLPSEHTGKTDFADSHRDFAGFSVQFTPPSHFRV